MVDGHEVDNGQHVFLGCCDAFIAFVERVGMRDRLHLQDRFDAVVLGRNARSRLRATPGLPPPLDLAGSLLGYRFLSLAGRLGIGEGAVLAAPRSAGVARAHRPRATAPRPRTSGDSGVLGSRSSCPARQRAARPGPAPGEAAFVLVDRVSAAPAGRTLRLVDRSRWPGRRSRGHDAWTASTAQPP